MKNKSGFTLVEILAASIILAVLMLYGTSFFAFSQRPATNAKEASFATQVIKDDFEQIAGDCVLLSSYTVALPAGGGVAKEVKDDVTGITFTKKRWVTDSPNLVNAIPSYKLVTTTVTWTAAGSRQAHSMAMTTIFSIPYPARVN